MTQPAWVIVAATDVEPRALAAHLVRDLGRRDGGRPRRADAAGRSSRVSLRLAEGGIVGHAAYRLDGADCLPGGDRQPAARIGASARRSWPRSRRRRAEQGAIGCLVDTTNDNVDALRFYQRRGYQIVAVRPGAVDEARRTLKPTIPEVGRSGIPMRDELTLEKRL